MDLGKKEQSRLNQFQSNPSRALWTLAIPMMAGMGIQTFYNIVDMIFIGRLGGDAIAGIAFNMPLFFSCTRANHGAWNWCYSINSKIHW